MGSGASSGTHAVPGNMYAAIFANSDVSTSNRAHRHGRVRLTVHWDWLGKVSLPRLAADIENIPAFRIAFVIDQVDDSFSVNCSLWEDTVVGGLDRLDRRALSGSRANSEENRNE
jgi:hypothetical protein